MSEEHRAVAPHDEQQPRQMPEIERHGESVPFDLIDLAFMTISAFFPYAIPLTLAQYAARRIPPVRNWFIRQTQRTASGMIAHCNHALPPSSTTTGGDGQAQQPAQPDAQNDLLEELAESDHLLVVGHTGGGKTTLLHGLAQHLGSTDAGVTVCDPDSLGGVYPGYRCVGAADDFPAIGTALVLVQREAERRRRARRDGVKDFRAMWIIVDETHDVVREVQGAWDILESIIRRGRKINIHAAIGTQDSQVKTLGLEGKGALLHNLTRVDVKKVRPGGSENAGSRGGTFQRMAYIDGDKEGTQIPHLPSPDDIVVRGRPVGAQFAYDPKTMLLTLLDTPPDEDATTGLPHSNQESTGRPDWSARPAPTGLPAQPGRESDSLARRVEAPTNAEILAKFQELGSKNQTASWVGDQTGIRGKESQYALINAALDENIREMYTELGSSRAAVEAWLRATYPIKPDSKVPKYVDRALQDMEMSSTDGDDNANEPPGTSGDVG